ncbi:hypothetical protein K7432_014549 [Basidiobolus ranarum]|uniref:DUF1905 domain-containing protein n=1 Tax=Basidiobolus ranarum TaxID=34480 RepID=A0ABR2WHE6_9FUNG
MSRILLETKLFTINEWAIIQLPSSASNQLPSRGLTAVDGIINSYVFKATLEPDGKGGHWLRVDETMSTAAGVKAGDNVELEVKPTKIWPKPEAPADFKEALVKVPEAETLWMKITPNAQWEWVRWIRAAKESGTREKRIEIACSKRKAGSRRPCCFNRNLCTEPSVSHNGVLLEPNTITESLSDKQTQISRKRKYNDT